MSEKVIKPGFRTRKLVLAGLMLAGALAAEAVAPGDGPALIGMLLGGFAGWLAARGRKTQRPVVLRREDDNLFRMRKG